MLEHFLLSSSTRVHADSVTGLDNNEKVGIISDKHDPISDSETKVIVSYEYIALNEKGREFIASFTSEHTGNLLANGNNY
ncbi:MAG: hypothetical protein GY785_26255 [Gammaproteobacteria bacterium]|nr:hypothetical protein [Gammaproteobacteria bacterium]MCP4981371.1 hypothetical protein [Gammaproteobacteria bacterium]